MPPPAEDHTPGRLLAEEKKPKRKFCNTTTYSLKGDYAYEACGAFCKQAKATNHCKFCKCRACSFCKAAVAASGGGSSSRVSSSSSSSASASSAAAEGAT